MALGQQRLTQEILEHQYEVEVRQTVLQQHQQIQQLNIEIQKLKKIEKKYNELQDTKNPGELS